MFKIFDLETLATMDDGRLGEAFKQALARCRVDLEDRPGTKDPRKVTLTASLKPVCDDAGNLDTVDVAFDVKDSVPVRKSRRYSMRPQRGALAYNDMAPEDADQLTLDDLGPQEGVSHVG